MYRFYAGRRNQIAHTFAALKCHYRHGPKFLHKKLCCLADAPCQSKSYQMLHNCRKSYAVPQQIEVMQLQGCSRPTCNKLCATGHGHHSCDPQARPSTSFFVDNNVDSEFGTKFQRVVEVPLFLEVPEFPQHGVG